MNREQASIQKHVNALNAQTIATNTTTVGNVIDTQGFDALTLVIHSATITDGVYTPLVQECDTSGGTYTDVADADLTVLESSIAFISTDDNVAKKIGYTGTKRYVKLSIVSTGVTTGGALNAAGVLGCPADAPVA